EPGATIRPWEYRLGGEGVAVEAVATQEEEPGRLGRPSFALRYDRSGHRLIVDWRGDLPPPEAGVLRASMMLEQSRLKRRENALQKVLGRAAPLPRLGDLLEGRVFDGAARWKDRPVPRKVKEIFGGEPTRSQADA